MKKSSKKNSVKKTVTPESARTESHNSGNGNGLKKIYSHTRPICIVTFVLPKEAAPGAKIVNLVGDFNNWDHELTRMKKAGNGDHTLTLELEKGAEFRFRYLIDNARWENDWHADKYLPNPFGGDDSVVVT